MKPVTIIIWLNLAAIAVLVMVYPQLMISPGALLEGHADLTGDCFACHTPFLRSAPENCIACHKLDDIGIRTTTGKKIEKKPGQVPFHQRLMESDCVACHSDHQGVKVYRLIHRFSHDLLKESGREQCKACHDKPDDTLHQPITMNCNACHETGKWTPAAFDHNRYFTQSGSRDCLDCHKPYDDRLHRNSRAACDSCHTTREWVPAKFDHRSYFSATNDRLCSGCHATLDDRLHRQLRGSCDSCHTIEAWKPATFDHDDYFRFDRHHDTECETCHTGHDYSKYTCYGCHEHSPAGVREEHMEEGIRDFSQCTECHRSGDEHEAERIWKQKRGLSSGTKYDD
ncbi:MAG: class III cytochrome C family protein [Gammaproteobacteria bacterium]|nr:class III cytochrome C family protein [Gammaproteobacteria bacterium]